MSEMKAPSVAESYKKFSPIEKILLIIPSLLFFVSAGRLVGYIGSRFGAKRAWMDVYVLAWAAALSFLFFEPYSHPYVAIILAWYRIADVVNYRMYFIFVKSRGRPWESAQMRRSVALALINLYEVILAFAIIYLFTGAIQDSTGKIVTDHFTALYFSFVTMATVGYGDFIPANSMARNTVMAQIATVIVLIVMLLPALISLMAAQLQKDE
jgi:ion channel